MKKIYFLIFLGMAIAGSGVLFGAQSEETEGVRHQGIIFNIAKDRQITKVGGIYEPEGLDRYIERRMNEVLERLRSLETKLDEAHQKLDRLSAQLAAQNKTVADGDFVQS